MPALQSLRLIGPGGANRAMEAEVKRLFPRALQRRPPEAQRVDTQTLVYAFDPDFARFAAHYLRTPTRVLWDLFEVEAERLEPLYEEVKAWIASERPSWLASRISVKVQEPADFPASGLQIRGTIKNAVIDGAKAHGMEVVLDADHPEVQLTVRGKKKPLLIGIDLAGESMHARGWRLEEGTAPIKENLAAEMLMLARWDTRTEALLDPLAGAGTLAIEGVLMGLAAPLWAGGKVPAIERLAMYKDKPRGELPALFADAMPAVFANEIHTPLVDVISRNASRAGVADRLLAIHGDVGDVDQDRLVREVQRRAPPMFPKSVDLSKGLIIGNPPYGERLEKGRGKEAELAQLYQELVDLHRRLGPGWRAAYIMANPLFEEIYGVRPAMKKPMWNGPISASFLVYGPI